MREPKCVQNILSGMHSWIWAAPFWVNVEFLQHSYQVIYWPFFHHYQGSIDFNIVNIHPTAAMYLFVSTGNRNDIEWNDQQWS